MLLNLHLQEVGGMNDEPCPTNSGIYVIPNLQQDLSSNYNIFLELEAWESKGI